MGRRSNSHRAVAPASPVYKEGMMRRLLVKLVAMAYKRGRDDERKGCDADIATFERLVAQILD